MPCHLAHTIPNLHFDTVLEHSMADIWQNSAAFQAFRGEGWMLEPCKSCDRRGVDFGGCRCQAFHLTGDARTADPACALSPEHSKIVAARNTPAERLVPLQLVYRGAPRIA